MKKIIAITTTLTIAVLLTGGTAEALTAAELQAQITALTAQLATLQAQLTALGGSIGAPAACAGITSLTTNLSQGSSGNDVKCLQGLLNKSAATQVAATGVGSAGSETTYFGTKTKAAVIKYQTANSVPATGYVGTLTRTKLNEKLTTTSTSSSITITSPIGGEIWEKGKTYNITWNSTAISDVLISWTKMDDLDKNQTGWITPTNSQGRHTVSNSGSYSWTIPSNLTNGQYIVQVFNYDPNTPGSQSTYATTPVANSGTFNIVTPTLPVSYPQITNVNLGIGERTLTITDWRTITWQYGNVPSGASRNVDIHLVVGEGNAYDKLIASNISPTVSQTAGVYGYSWRVGYLQNNVIVPEGSNYSIKVCPTGVSVSNSNCSSLNYSFTLKKPAVDTRNITSAGLDGGTTATLNENRTISWQIGGTGWATNTADRKVDIWSSEYLGTNLGYAHLVASNVSPTLVGGVYTYVWKVGTLKGGTTSYFNPNAQFGITVCPAGTTSNVYCAGDPRTYTLILSSESCGSNGAVCNYEQICIVDGSGVGTCKKSISDIAREKCIKVGAIMQYRLMTSSEGLVDSESARIYKKRMNNFATIVTPENELKWGSVQPNNKDSFDFTAADAIMNFAYDNGIEVKVHAPIWYSQNPSWIQNLNCDQLKAAYKNYVLTVLNRYKGKISYWDLVNEPIDHDFVYQDKCGYNGFLDFAAEISKLIKTLDPNIILIVNEYGVEEPYNDKIVNLYNWVQDLTANHGAIVDQIGFQYHGMNSFSSSNEGGHINYWASRFGKSIAITELDASSDVFKGCANRPDWGYQEGCQANYYGSIAEFAFSSSNISYLNFWTFWDKSAWVANSGFYRNDASASQKPSLKTIWQKVNEAPSRCGP